MRIEAISLNWFRGAANKATLETNCKSILVYGTNGSGKSSFLDAVEYVLQGGRVGHLSHEYSGKEQEKGLLNTHAPAAEQCGFNIVFADKSTLLVSLDRDGDASFSGAEHIRMPEWDYRCTILRQEEVAAFISARKGEKYSALVPLLGLEHLEIAAENLRKLAKAIEQRPSVQEKRQQLNSAQSAHVAQFGSQPEVQIWTFIRGLYKKYVMSHGMEDDPTRLCLELDRELTKRVSSSSNDQRHYHAMIDVRNHMMEDKIAHVRTASVDLAQAAEPLILERLEVLQAAGRFTGKLHDSNEVLCPACGQKVSVDVFQAHVEAEQSRLKDLIARFDKKQAALSGMLEAVKATKTALERPELATWRERESQAGVRDALLALGRMDLERLRAACLEKTLREIEAASRLISERVALEILDAPPDVQVLSKDKEKVGGASALLAARRLKSELNEIDDLICFVVKLEKRVRYEIRQRSLL